MTNFFAFDAAELNRVFARFADPAAFEDCADQLRFLLWLAVLFRKVSHSRGSIFDGFHQHDVEIVTALHKHVPDVTVRQIARHQKRAGEMVILLSNRSNRLVEIPIVKRKNRGVVFHALRLLSR